MPPTLLGIFVCAGVDKRRWDLNFEGVLEKSQLTLNSRPCLQILNFRVVDSRAYAHDKIYGF